MWRGLWEVSVFLRMSAAYRGADSQAGFLHVVSIPARDCVMGISADPVLLPARSLASSGTHGPSNWLLKFIVHICVLFSLPEHHPCTLPCHAPSSCPELEPCRAVVTLMCACNRIRQTAPCARSTLNLSGGESTHQPKCNNECAIAKRNARLAEALGINQENRGKAGAAVFSDDLVSFARVNPKLLGLVEKAFSE